MPYVEHNSFHPPSNANAIVWRYIDCKRYLSLLAEEALFFSSLRALRADDPYEGAMTQADWRYSLRESGVDIAEEWREMSDLFAQLAYVNCWHISNNESMAMWRLYSSKGDGIAIKSTYGRLRESMRLAQEDIYISDVSYVNYREYVTTRRNAIDNILLKRDAFKHEKELRAVYLPTSQFLNKRYPGLDELKDAVGQTGKLLGHNIKVELKLLMWQVVLSPFAPEWLFQSIQSVTEHYGLLPSIVTKSKLGGNPRYKIPQSQA